MVDIASIHSWNEETSNRGCVETTMLNIPQGVWNGTADLQTAAGEEVQAHPKGAQWDDGTYRYALVALPPITINAGALDVTTLIRTGTGTAAPTFALHPDVLTATLLWRLAVGPYQMSVFADMDDLVNLGWTQTLDGPYMQRWNFIEPYNDGAKAIFEIDMELYAGVPEIKWYCRVSFADRNSTTVDIPLAGQVSLEFFGHDCIILHDARVQEITRTSTYQLWKLLDQVTITEGQEPSFIGMIGFGSQPAIVPVRSISDGWETSFAGTPGWTFFEPQPAGYNNKTEADLEYAGFSSSSHIFERGQHGLNNRPGDPGDQQDSFGPVPGLPAFWTNPYVIKGHERSYMQNGGRPTHIRYPGDDHVQHENYASTVGIFSEQIDERFSVAVGNILQYGKGKGGFGKERGQGYAAPAGPLEGRSNQHWIAGPDVLFYLRTGNLWSEKEILHLVQSYLGEMTVTSGTSLDTNMSASRAVGRQMLSACNLWLATGDDTVKTRALARVDKLVTLRAARQPSGVGPLWWQNAPESVGFYPVGHPRAGQTIPWGSPWMETIGMMGLYAVWKLWGYAPALTLAQEAGEFTFANHFGESGGIVDSSYRYEFDQDTGATLSYNFSSPPGVSTGGKSFSIGSGTHLWTLAGAILWQEITTGNITADLWASKVRAQFADATASGGTPGAWTEQEILRWRSIGGVTCPIAQIAPAVLSVPSVTVESNVVVVTMPKPIGRVLAVPGVEVLLPTSTATITANITSGALTAASVTVSPATVTLASPIGRFIYAPVAFARTTTVLTITVAPGNIGIGLISSLVLSILEPTVTSLAIARPPVIGRQLFAPEAQFIVNTATNAMFGSTGLILGVPEVTVKAGTGVAVDPIPTVSTSLGASVTIGPRVGRDITPITLIVPQPTLTTEVNVVASTVAMVMSVLEIAELHVRTVLPSVPSTNPMSSPSTRRTTTSSTIQPSLRKQLEFFLLE